MSIGTAYSVHGGEANHLPTTRVWPNSLHEGYQVQN
eukprot:CAMPEP_0170876668 /NCGR_PEP_ID=MMETSP0734-20130129/29790_1 /TAXON_ID=186038 /ORGANISM="Fragilariopsis kerguelensis, Strain L26-C5" /LENGTH=35 /DNA_ID= /DNA_START= /DNA_END= /DNA_ORIENTATION=